MTAHSLARIVAEELASVGIGTERGVGAWGAPRRTTWSQTLPGFGVRHYGVRRKVYIVQLLMGGRTRTVTIGNAALFTDAEAVAVARRILLPSDRLFPLLRTGITAPLLRGAGQRSLERLVGRSTPPSIQLPQ
jgi:hypothetical protein